MLDTKMLIVDDDTLADFRDLDVRLFRFFYGEAVAGGTLSTRIKFLKLVEEVAVEILVARCAWGSAVLRCLGGIVAAVKGKGNAKGAEAQNRQKAHADDEDLGACWHLGLGCRRLSVRRIWLVRHLLRVLLRSV